MNELSKVEIEKRLVKLNGWSSNNNKLVKKFEFENFKKAVEFVNKVGKVAERLNHHPNVYLHSYKKVDIETSTHSKNGITEKDFKLVGEIEKL